MNLGKLVRQLRREASAHPKKAAVLGLLVVVALYYWGPLVWGWVAADEAAAPPPEGPPAAIGASTGEVAVGVIGTPPTPEAPKVSARPWTQVDEWMRQDPMTTPVEDVTDWHDPFAVATAQPEAVNPKVDRHKVPVARPEQMGIELSGTLVGPHRRVALIGGKAYREGQTVKTERGSPRIEFELAEVHSGRIVLTRKGHRFDLRIPAGK
jgi:hypothetical protein